MYLLGSAREAFMKLDPKSQTNWEEAPALDPFKSRERHKRAVQRDAKTMAWFKAYFDKVFFFFLFLFIFVKG